MSRHDDVSRALVQGILDGGLEIRPLRRAVVVAVTSDRGHAGVVTVLDREHGHAELHGGGQHPQPLARLRALAVHLDQPVLALALD